ncbi:unnamed protein product [Enterobius vermicularis]|uniref:TLC domain-containing protein n=1 Tax=Enterobius vermicularis TaxID=51028 RepID=A0A0N4UYM9_ENTVE|nr:unnamed protein product [Enterobius vermicularis]
MLEEPLLQDGQLYPPPISRIFTSSFYIPFLSYITLFLLIQYFVQKFLYTQYTGFRQLKECRQYRLRNLTVCLIHSMISGIWAFSFVLFHPYVFFFETMHWYQSWAAQLPLLSMGYFVCDTLDMLRHEISRWTIELLLHHTASLFVFACSVLPQKFLPYAYGALLMEVNSIFLHIRTLMQITGKNKTEEKKFHVVQTLNITTFVVFRFAVQTWQITWAWVYRYDMHIFYVFVGVVGGGFFLIVNTILFVRVLASDGYLGEYGRKHTAIDR